MKKSLVVWQGVRIYNSCIRNQIYHFLYCFDIFFLHFLDKQASSPTLFKYYFRR